MSLRIAVCDDDREMLFVISNQLNSIFAKKKMIWTLELFEEGGALLKAHERNPFQAVFLDISMPGKDGFQIAGTLREHSKEVMIVFVTSKDELVYRSFDYQPFHFIRKKDFKSLEAQLLHVVEKLTDYHNLHKRITLALPYGTEEDIAVSSIVTVQSEKNYLEYELDDKRVLRVRDSLNAAEEELKKYGFIRISSRVLVNGEYIVRVKEREGEVVLKSGFVYSMSRNYKKDVVAAYMKYLRSRS